MGGLRTLLILSGIGLLAWGGLSQAQQVHRNNFEAAKTWWVKSGADAAFDETRHVMTDQAHDGQRAELIQLNAKEGSFIHYQYPLGKGLINDEFSASVWIKANRPDIQLLARV